MVGQFKSAFAVGVSIIAMGVALPAHAQDGSADAEPAADTGGINEIIVTSQRREENLQDVPISVSAFTADQVLARGITDVGRLEGIVPGFTFGRSGQDARPSIRGVRTENVGVNGDTTIGFFIDGVYQSRATQATAGFVDVERVEVQRGPQGTLYGRNTFGGNIAITTAQPVLGEMLGGLDVTVGEYGRFRTDAFVNLPVSDTLAVRVAGSLEKSDGWVKNVNPLGNNLFDDDSKYLRATVLWEPNDQFSAAIKFDYSTRGGAGGSAFGYKIIGSYFDVGSRQQLYNGTPVLNLNTRGGNRDGVNDALPGGTATSDLGVPVFAPGDGYTIDTDQKTILDLENKAITANLAYDFGGITLRSITGYTDFGAIRTQDSDFSGNQIAIDYQDTRAETFSQEIQLLSSDTASRLDWVVGAYYFHDELTGVFINQQLPRIIRNVTPNLTLPQNGGGFYDQQRATTESVAFYGQATYEVVDNLRVTAGIRWTEDTKDFAFANANAVLPTSGTPPVPQGTAITLNTGPIPDSAFGAQGAATNCTYTTFPPPRPGFQCLAANTAVLTGATYDTAKFRKATWRLAVDYDVTPDNLLYASVSTGFRSGGFNSGQGPAALQPTFDPEEVTAYEIGSKNRFFDNTVQLNLAAFYNRYNGLQEQRQVPQGGTTLSIIENSGRARAYGGEAELLWRPVTGLEIGANVAYLNAKYTEYDQVPAPFGTSILVTDATQTTPTIVNGVQIAAAGQRRVFAPGYDCGLIPGTGGTGQPAAAFGCDISGNSIPHSPDWTGAVFAGYDIDLGSLGTLTPFAIMTFSSSFFGQPFNSVLEQQPSFQKVDLRLTWAPTDFISIQGFVNNVTDERTINRFVWGGGGALQASFAPPRQWGALLSIRF
ncbi:iron complex outermembrane receptor protein [Erythromicrobium ramosum]|nr:TonB-dependent receptor [Erythrobacter ramosus]MBB3774982.1 iron complex outermembrane receptor protein [Erythrobacter ramosus]